MIGLERFVVSEDLVWIRYYLTIMRCQTLLSYL